MRREMIEGGLHDVYNRFARGEEIFADPEEAIAFVDRLHETKARDEFTVFAWVLVSNHFQYGSSNIRRASLENDALPSEWFQP